MIEEKISYESRKEKLPTKKMAKTNFPSCPQTLLFFFSVAGDKRQYLAASSSVAHLLSIVLTFSIIIFTEALGTQRSPIYYYQILQSRLARFRSILYKLLETQSLTFFPRGINYFLDCCFRYSLNLIISQISF